MADTLLSVAQEELAKAQAEQTRATSDLTAAQTDLATAQQDLAAATTALVGFEDAAASIQRQIAQTTIAADGQQLFDDLDANTTQARSRQVAIVDGQERVAYATSRTGRAQDELQQAAAAAAASQAAITVTTKQDADHATWTTAATTPPLSSLPGQSDVTVAGPAKSAADAATARLDGGSGGDVPHDLFVQAQARRQLRIDRLTAIAASVVAAEDGEAAAAAAAGYAGAATQAQLSFTRSEAALRDFALTAQERYNRALGLLAGVTGGTPLNSVEEARIATLFQAATTANSFNLQQARDTAQATLDQGEDAVDAAVLAALTADPTKDPSTDAGVQAANAALPAWQLDVTNDETAYVGAGPGGPKDALDQLEAGVPAATWSLFDDYQEALSLLADLAATNPATLAASLATDEDTYAKALRTVQDNARTVLTLGEVMQERDDRAAAAAQTQQSRLLQALRGDE
jgi:hypothetical protein